MSEADSALSLVDVLAAGATRTKGINLAFAQQVFIGFRQNDHVCLAVELAFDLMIQRSVGHWFGFSLRNLGELCVSAVNKRSISSPQRCGGRGARAEDFKLEQYSKTKTCHLGIIGAPSLAER